MSKFKVIVNVTSDGVNQTLRRTYDEKPTKKNIDYHVAQCFARFGGLAKPRKRDTK